MHRPATAIPLPTTPTTAAPLTNPNHGPDGITERLDQGIEGCASPHSPAGSRGKDPSGLGVGVPGNVRLLVRDEVELAASVNQ
jgi:hypothetical protein